MAFPLWIRSELVPSSGTQAHFPIFPHPKYSHFYMTYRGHIIVFYSDYKIMSGMGFALGSASHACGTGEADAATGVVDVHGDTGLARYHRSWPRRWYLFTGCTWSGWSSRFCVSAWGAPVSIPGNSATGA